MTNKVNKLMILLALQAVITLPGSIHSAALPQPVKLGPIDPFPPDPCAGKYGRTKDCPTPPTSPL